ncbi:MAG: hypothetical protein F9K16_03460 [Thermoanaerobaculia bacterium]|nr:MAG: hypothetical protein F9K16_03460 [Thermoanaerobaculia bacterium]MBZ0100807.1 YfhO family protein [Thermoanaerobaculia bacterium]
MTDRPGRWRTLALVAPVAVLVVLQVLPLVTGARTLILRDVLNTHAALRVGLADGLRGGELPLVDPLRSGGQALAGNANVLAFYPDNLLLLVGSNLWQLNLHFVLHWLLAFLAAYWLGRSWGLAREGSIAGAVVFALSGYWLSQMNFYNAVAPVSLAPALWAALLEAGTPERRRRGLLVAGLAWGLMVLGGDPIVALVGLGSGLLLALARHGRSLPRARLALALGLGTLLALPQIVETLRILPMSYRAVQGYAESGGGVRDPRAVLDLLIPLFFGRPDVGAIWGKAIFDGHPPIYFTLAPGWLALALAAAAGVPRRREGRWLAAAAGLATLVTFSGGTPIPGWLTALPGGQLLRFPEKAFLVAALALALAAGCAFDRLVRGDGPRHLALALGGVLALGGTLWLLFGVAALGGESLFVRLFAELDARAAWGERHLRWAGLSMFGTALVVLVSTTLLALRRRPRVAGALLLTLHAGSQLAFLRPLLADDESAGFSRPPAIAGEVDPAAVLVQGAVTELFGDEDISDLAPLFPDRHVRWLHRIAWSELLSFAALEAGRRLEFDISPEGLDTFVCAATARGMSHFDDTRRIAVLRATGVDRLLLGRALVPEGAGGARRLTTVQTLARPVHVYEVPAPLPEVALAGAIVRAPHMNAALEAIWISGFDPSSTAVIPGSGPPVVAPPGTARLAVSEREHVEVEIDSPSGGVLILRRAHLPIWRATIDGAPAPTVIAQLTRLAVEVPPGPHRVVFSISRWPLRISGTVALLALAALVVLWRRDGRRTTAG